MNQEIQELSIDELETVDGSRLDIDPPKAQAVEFPEVVNNPPG